MPIDLVVCLASVFSFGVFLGVHLLLMRHVRPEALLKSLMVLFIFALAVHCLVIALLWNAKAAPLSGMQWLAGLAVSGGILGLLCFNYILCVFGPYETSVRMRLVREIGRIPGGIQEDELLKAYNDQVIVQMRLRRLVGAGDITVENGVYRSKNGTNMFFFRDRGASLLKAWIGTKP